MDHYSTTSIDTPGMWTLYSMFGTPLSLCQSLRRALQKAYELSGATESLYDAPSVLVRAGTNDRIDAYEILALWQKLQWPLPSRVA